jgi:branched-chain amino acid aminotransferase
LNRRRNRGAVAWFRARRRRGQPGGNEMAGVPFDKMTGKIWLNGAFVDWEDAKIHVLTHGLHYASCVFEGERAYGGEIFKLRDHTERLFASARILDFAIPYSEEEIDAVCRELLVLNSLSDAYVRPAAWRGSEMMGVSAQKNRINVAIAVWDWPSYFSPEERLRGIRLDISEWRRPDPRTIPAKAKAAGLYMICTLSKHAAERKGYADALMFDWRGDRRQRLLHQGRQDPHADAGLFPRRHHPPDGDRAGAGARHRGDRARDHAG